MSAVSCYITACAVDAYCLITRAWSVNCSVTLLSMMHTLMYNNMNYGCLFIGFCWWSVGGQMLRWHYHQQFFASLSYKTIGHVLLWICSVTDHRSCQNVLTIWLQWVTKTEFSLQYQYNIKQTVDENKEKYQLGDYKLIQHQILQTNIIRTVRRQ